MSEILTVKEIATLLFQTTYSCDDVHRIISSHENLRAGGTVPATDRQTFPCPGSNEQGIAKAIAYDENL